MQQFGVVGITTFQNFRIIDNCIQIKPFSDLESVIKLNVIDFVRIHLLSYKRTIKMFESEDKKTYFGYQNQNLVGEIEGRPFEVDFSNIQMPISVVAEQINQQLKSNDDQILVDSFNTNYEVDGMSLTLTELGDIHLKTEFEGIHLRLSNNALIFFSSLCGSLSNGGEESKYENKLFLNNIDFPNQNVSLIKSGVVSLSLKNIVVMPDDQLSKLPEKVLNNYNAVVAKSIELNEKNPSELLNVQFDLNAFKFSPEIVDKLVENCFTVISAKLNKIKEMNK